MTCISGPAWTPSERLAVKRAYLTGGLPAAKAALPHRPSGSICHIAKKLGLTKPINWTRREDAVLRNRWGVDRVSAIAKDLGRSEIGVWRRAKKLGLPFGVPQGYESLAEAARRIGYADRTFAKILRWAGVQTRRIPSAVATGQSHWKVIVDTFDADEAVEAWNKTETRMDAARRHGVSWEQMDKWLRATGVVSGTSRRQARLDPAVVDRVVAERRAKGRAS